MSDANHHAMVVLGWFLNLSQESKDAVKLGMGLVATMAALIVGLLIASAKSSFDGQDVEFKQAAADTLLLDRVARGRLTSSNAGQR